MRVGSTTSQEADVRVIAATNRQPELALSSGKLREDLLYRLNVFPIHLPPLRERLDDVPLLAEHFLGRIGEQEGRAKRFTPQALARLQRYAWPGNVRELRNVVQRAYVMAPADAIDDSWLPPATPGLGAVPTASTGAEPASEAAAASPTGLNGASVSLPIGTSMAQAERALILATLQHYNFQKERTAAVLGISLKTLYNRLKDYNADGGPAP